jgi:hypothetical protein
MSRCPGDKGQVVPEKIRAGINPYHPSIRKGFFKHPVRYKDFAG